MLGRVLGFAFVLAGCGSSAHEPPIGSLERSTTVDDDVMHVHAAGRAVPLHEVAEITEHLGLPMNGTGDIDVDVSVPLVRGQPDFTRATGSAALRCAPCALGDDAAVLATKRHGAFGGDLHFGHVAFDTVDLQLAFAGGHADITRWVVRSADVRLEAALHVDLDRTFAHSRVRGCVRFAPTPDLAKRDANLATMLQLVGAPRGPDDLYAVKLDGTLDEPRLLAMLCDQP